MVGQSNYSITLGRKVSADFKRKHRKWPLGTTVMVMTPAGYLRGRISKHWRRTENHHGATVEFPEVVDMGDANGARYCHVIPFRSMKPVPVTGVTKKLLKHLKSLTELNLHGECYETAAQALGLPKLVEEFGRINREHARRGYLTWELNAVQRAAYEKLLAEAQRTLPAGLYDKLYRCF